MLLRPFVYCLIFIAGNSCKNNNEKAESSQLNQELSIRSSDTDNVDGDFSSFIEKFSKDSAFQLNRTKLPLKIKQYDIENDKDTIIFKHGSEFEMMDFRKKKSDTKYDQWKQEIVLNKGENKATIEIRGIENGIVLDYYFEKNDGKWMLVGVNDSST